MPNPKTGMVGQRVPLSDGTGNASRPWFQLWFYLWLLTGSGQSTMTLTDLQVAPEGAGVTEAVTELQKAVDGLLAAPAVQPPASTLVGAVSATLDFPNTLAQTSSDLTITVTGCVQGDVVRLSVPNAVVVANSCYTAWVSAADTVTVRFNNYSAAAINPGSASYRVVVDRI